MTNILITGATGNIGSEVIQFLMEKETGLDVIAAVRDIQKSEKAFSGNEQLKFVKFDFEEKETFKAAFTSIDILFLLRPPQLADVDRYFDPLLKEAKEAGINKIVFLSVQGAELSKVIPHNKIERLIKSYGFEYIFVRPSYFMQNLTTTLLPEIKKDHRITLPSGNAKFNWVDVVSIGEASAVLISRFEEFKNKAFEITGNENLNFKAVTELMSDVLDRKIEFISLNPVSFYFKKKKQGTPSDFALVMTMLHFLPRIQGEPTISDAFFQLTGKQPSTLKEFLEREKAVLT
ncbi:NmrA family NAD(P)-binding protein [Algoriphagus sp.]|uniref:NmrA family NAD(P)-binding protein n=1 Tax=Algoriphagus sp. TaxID=1872435 RepID=UPI0032899642